MSHSSFRDIPFLSREDLRRRFTAPGVNTANTGNLPVGDLINEATMPGTAAITTMDDIVL